MRYSEQRQLINDLPVEKGSQVHRRAKRKCDSQEDEGEDDGGVPLTPKKASKTSSILNAQTQSPSSLTSRRRIAKRFALKEVVDDLKEEAQREANFADQTTAVASKGAGDKAKALIEERWPAGLLQYLDESIRPTSLSSRLLKNFAVLAYYVSVVEANQMLLAYAGSRTVGPADIKAVVLKRTGQSWVEVATESHGDRFDDEVLRSPPDA